MGDWWQNLLAKAESASPPNLTNLIGKLESCSAPQFNGLITALEKSVAPSLSQLTLQLESVAMPKKALVDHTKMTVNGEEYRVSTYTLDFEKLKKKFEKV